MQPTEDFLVPFPNSYVFGVAVLYPISLTPRFSEVCGRVCYHNRFGGLLVDYKKPLKRLGRAEASLTPNSSTVLIRSQSTLNYIQTRFRLEALPTQVSLRACRADEHPG